MSMDGQKPKLRHRLKWTWLHQFLHDNHGVRYFVIAIALIISSGLAVLGFMLAQPVAEPTTVYPVAQKKPEAPKY